MVISCLAICMMYAPAGRRLIVGDFALVVCQGLRLSPELIDLLVTYFSNREYEVVQNT